MLQIPLFVNAAAPTSYDDAQKRAETTGSCFAKKRQVLAALSFSIGGSLAYALGGVDGQESCR
jgi:hypothetical protein